MNMTPNEKSEMREQLKEYIEMRVHSSNQTHEKLLSDLMKEVKALRLSVEPVVSFFNNMTFTNKFVMGFLKVVALIGTATAVIYGAIYWLKH